MGFFSRLFGLEKNNKQDQIQRRKQSTKSKSKTYPLNEKYFNNYMTTVPKIEFKLIDSELF